MCAGPACAPSAHTWTSRGMGIPMVLSKEERLTNSAGSTFRVSACRGGTPHNIRKPCAGDSCGGYGSTATFLPYLFSHVPTDRFSRPTSSR